MHRGSAGKMLADGDVTKHRRHPLLQISAGFRRRRFLRNMVRAIVGTMFEVGRNKLTIKEFTQIIEQRERGAAGISAPAKGLFLEEVAYPY